MPRYDDLPYRTCVGMMLINKDGLVFIGRRASGIEHVDDTHVWQMPYGGADKTVDVHVSWLRRKLGETAQQPRYLHTVRGVGIKLTAPP